MHINVTTATADLVRAAAPKFGLIASGARNIIAPGVERIDLPPLIGAKYTLFRNISETDDEAVRRIINAA